MAMLFKDLNLLYIIVPGTGSNSFHSGMRNKYKMTNIKIPANHPCRDINRITHEAHFTAEQIRMVLGEKEWNSYDKIGFIRHPYDWINSLYNKGGVEVLGMDNTLPYSEFVADMNLTPYSWLTDEYGNVIVDKIFRTEDLDDGLFQKFGIPPNHINKSSKPKNHLTDDDIKIVREKFYREFKHYANIS